MNIVQLSKYYPPNLGGIELVADMISKSHVDAGHDMQVIAFGNKNLFYLGSHKEKVTIFKRHLHILSTPINFNLLFTFKKIINQNNFNILYLHIPNPWLLLLINLYKKTLKKKNIKLFIVFHCDIRKSKLLTKLYNYITKKQLQISDKIICSSNELWNSSPLLSEVPISKKNIIPFTIEENNTPIATPRVSFNKNILAIGRLVPYKGFEYLIEATKNSPFNLYIIGDGPLRNKLKNISHENVFILGKVSDEEKQNYFSKCDILCLPSIDESEAYGMVIVEAFKNSMPVVASKINTGVSYLVKNEERGLLVTPKKPSDLRDSFYYLSDNPDKYKNFSSNCINFYKSELGYDKFKNRINKLII